jgi:hypothetical protein
LAVDLTPHMLDFCSDLWKLHGPDLIGLVLAENGFTSQPIWPMAPKPSGAPPPQGKVNLMAGERELTTGLLAKEASFRLIVSGKIGVKEIERLIKKLELDKEILADESDTAGIEDLM